MIRRRDLLRALGEHDVADWILVERDQERAIASATLQRNEKWLRWQLTVHHDAPTGRGSAHVAIDAADGDANAAVRQAVTLARASVATAWVSRPLAAPARVTVADPALVVGSLLDTAASIVRGVPAIDATATLLRERVHVETRQGLRANWQATEARFDALVGRGERRLAVTREARRRDDLSIAAALRDANDDLALLVAAKPPTTGPCALVLRADALLHGGLGLWSAFASQADAVVERQGLTRYREGSPIARDAGAVAVPLTIQSNGALDFGLASAPLGDEGDAVRRFMLVERGIATGLGLSPREGALRGRDPNGGVRNLIVASGTWDGRIAANAIRVIDVRRLRSLSVDPFTGDASLEIQLAVEHAPNGGAQTPITGGSLRLDAIAALATARRSSAMITRGAYVGPASVMIDGAGLFA